VGNSNESTLKIMTYVAVNTSIKLANTDYDLLCIINHEGTNLWHGHYTAASVVSQNNSDNVQFYLFDDSHVSRTKAVKTEFIPESIARSAYILCYKRREV
jgi:ubiquitin C-terminal hydrolase